MKSYQSTAKTTFLATVSAIGMLAATGAMADVLHYDDVIITGSLCIGWDCANGESFGYDTVRLKENNLRLHFNDTSVGSFPTTDWRIVINETTSGGQGYLSIEDADNGRHVFKIKAGAPANALYIEDYGRIGMGTGIPYTELHIADGDTPTMRLDQNGTSGWAAQVWDVAGNETNFFIRDVTNGSRLVLRIRPNAPSDSLHVHGTGNIGMGTASPEAALHVERNDGSAGILVEETSGTVAPRTLLNLQNAGRPDVVLGNTSTNGEWSFGAGTNFVLKQGTVGSDSASKTKMFEVRANGDATLLGSLTTGGTTCGGGCDAVFTDQVIIPAEDYAARMWANGYLPHVGPTPEGAPINVSQKLGGMLNALEHAHVFIDRQTRENLDQSALIDEQRRTIDGLSVEVETLAARLAELEQHFAQ